MSATQYIPVVARKYGLPPELIAALVQVESGGNRFAVRVEPAYPWLWDVGRDAPFRVSRHEAALRLPPAGFPAAPGLSRATEWIGQQSSWGWMQVMGAVARELGFRGFFSELSDPLLGLNYGCRHLVRYRDRWLAEFGWAGVVAAYNAGSPRRSGSGGWENQGYVDKVVAAGARGLA